MWRHNLCEFKDSLVYLLSSRKEKERGEENICFVRLYKFQNFLVLRTFYLGMVGVMYL